AAPPAGSEPGAVLITENLVDFLLEHELLRYVLGWDSSRSPDRSETPSSSAAPAGCPRSTHTPRRCEAGSPVHVDRPQSAAFSCLVVADEEVTLTCFRAFGTSRT